MADTVEAKVILEKHRKEDRKGKTTQTFHNLIALSVETSVISLESR